MDNSIRCYGCGAILQNEDASAIGYTPKKISDERMLCQRCFKLIHYHERGDLSLSADEFLKLLDAIGDQDALIVYIVDLFDFEASLIPGLMRHIGYNDVLVLGNKRDLLMKSLKDHKIRTWVYRQLKNQGIKAKEVILTSGKNNLNLDEIFEKIDAYRKGRDVYVIGMSNVGKSTLINALLKHYSDENHYLTVSEFPGTTLDLIEIPLDENSALYDTPGIINKGQMTSHVPNKMLKKIIPQSEIRPQTFQINAKQTLYFEGLARLDYLKGERQGFTCYLSRAIKVTRVKTDNADGIYDRHKTFTMGFDEITEIAQMKTYSFKLNKPSEIVISGLGFINMPHPGQVAIKVPEGIDVFVRESLI